MLAERLASELGQRVLVVDKRPHIGGNAYDRYDDAGVLIHPYGPHIFHTNSADIFDYLSRFTEWRPYQHRVLASVDGQLVPMPINLDTVNQLYGLKLTSFELEQFFESVAEKVEPVRTSEDVVVSKVGRDLYNKFFRGYTRKQWGLDPSELDASVTARVPTRTNRDDRYFTDTFQAMPLHGYTRMFEAMLDHPNIKVMTNTDYREIVDFIPWKHMVYSGPIDAYFDYKYGKLPYRSLRFEHATLPQEQFQAVGTVNFPNDYGYTRVSEFKHITGQTHASTSVVYEYPTAEGDPYYPVPRPENAALYKRYEEEADRRRERHLRRPAGDLQVLQHGPGRRPGARGVQAAARAPWAGHRQVDSGRRDGPQGLRTRQGRRGVAAPAGRAAEALKVLADPVAADHRAARGFRCRVC